MVYCHYWFWWYVNAVGQLCLYFMRVPVNYACQYNTIHFDMLPMAIGIYINYRYWFWSHVNAYEQLYADPGRFHLQWFQLRFRFQHTFSIPIPTPIPVILVTIPTPIPTPTLFLWTIPIPTPIPTPIPIQFQLQHSLYSDCDSRII